MSEMSSFYGGRQGNSIVIAKRFDGIDIPQPGDGVSGSVTAYTYTQNLYAIDSLTNEYIITTEAAGGNVPVGVYDSSTGSYVASTTDFLVARTSDNIDTSGWGWRVHKNNGDAINSTSFVFLEELAQGMIQFFAQGAKTASEVNYGAYVLIDTNLNMHEKNDPDNGKLYRRGMDINSDLAGAEYIGQIVGPQGEIAEVDIDTYSNVLKQSNVKTGSYTPTELVEGYDYDGHWNDNIEYAWANVKNELGEIDEYLLGFTFPYLTLDFDTSHVDPYDSTGKYADMSKITRTDDKSHPYYEKWHLDIPKGIKGDLIDNLRVVYYDVPAGVKYKFGGNEGLLPVKAQLKYKFYEYYDDTLNKEKWVDVYLWDEESKSYKPSGKSYEYQVQLKNAVAGLAYTETSFDNLEAGEEEYIYLGSYNIIEDVILAEDGTITVQYSHDEDKVLEQKIQWIDNIQLGSDGDFLVTYNTYEYDEEGKKTTTHNTYETSLKWVNGVSLNDYGILTFTYSNDPLNPYVYKSIKWIDDINQEENGTVTVTYNTLIDPDNPASAHESKTFDYCMKYIKSVSLAANGDFKMVFNTTHIDPSTGTEVNDEYTTKLYWVRTMDLTQDGTLTTTLNDGTSTTKTLNWVDLMQVEDDGTVSYYYNSDHSTPVDTQEKLIKWVEDVKLDGNNGLGSQQVSVSYNIDRDSYIAIGDPLNYLLETTVTTSRNDTPVKPYHLLVLYSDPDRRAEIPESEKAQYPSKYPQYQGQPKSADNTYMRTDWHDLGNIRGAKGGFNVICEVPNGFTDLQDDSTTPVQIPPEYILYAMNVRAAGDPYIYDEEVGRDEYYSGWGTIKVTTDATTGEKTSEFFFYDYEAGKWFTVGSISAGQAVPEEIVTVSESDTEPVTLEENGIWFVTYDRKMAN